MAHHRDLGRHDALDRSAHRDAALELHRRDAALLHQADRAAHRVLGRDLVGAEGHVAHHERARRGAAHEAAVVDHLVERHRQRRVEALRGVADRVADQQHLDAGLIEQACEGEVVGGEHREGLGALPGGERPGGDPVLAPRGRQSRWTSGRLRAPGRWPSEENASVRCPVVRRDLGCPAASAEHGRFRLPPRSRSTVRSAGCKRSGRSGGILVMWGARAQGGSRAGWGPRPAVPLCSTDEC